MLGIRWAPPAIGPSLVTGYYATWESVRLGDKVTTAVPGTATSIVLQNLEPLTSYYFTLRSFHRPNRNRNRGAGASTNVNNARDWLSSVGIGDDELTEIVSQPTEYLVVETDVPRPRAPILLPLTCPSPHEILVRWEEVPQAHPPIHQFSLYIRPSQENSWAYGQPNVHLRPADTRTKKPNTKVVQEGHNTTNQNQIDTLDMDMEASEAVDTLEQGPRIHEFLIQNLTSGISYLVGLSAGTRSNFDPDHYRHSNLSQVQLIQLDQKCGSGAGSELAEVAGEHDQGQDLLLLEIGAFILIGALIFGILIMGILIYICRRNSTGDWRILERNPASVSLEPSSGVGLGWEPQETSSVPIHLFPAHVAGLHADGDIGFSKEYETVQGSNLPTQFTTQHSSHPDNKLKNRYLNILAYDHTLVLSEGFGQKDSPRKRASCNPDYFNGNYIDGYHKACAYIGTQGPLPSTFETFWRVVWEHRVLVIVMITNLIERGRKKCDQYWPCEGTETYGLVSVRLIREESTGTFTTRTLGVRCLRGKKSRERRVIHFHYTNWPDHGTPSHNLPVLNFIRKSSGANWEEDGLGGQGAEGGPIIVHCSAGVGRTGTYIVIAEMLKQAKETGEINVLDYLHHIRKQRNFLVQTEEQYIFIHDALLEAVQSGETCMKLSHLPPYLHSLQYQTTREEDTGQVLTLLQRQYALVTQFQPKPFHYSQATRLPNVHKNRKPGEHLPIDPYRVLLIPKAGADGSDYINATFLPGYFKLREFIITQHPLESTVVGFWQMCLDHNVNRVVVLSETTEEEEDTEVQTKTCKKLGDLSEESEIFRPFWPSSGDDLVFDSFTVKLTEETSRVGFVIRSFALVSQSDDVELAVEMIISSSWPHHSQSQTPPPNLSPGSGIQGNPAPSEIFDLIQQVQDLDTSSPTPSTGPIVVVDKYGGVEAATFCLMSTVCHQLDSEGTLDIYQYAKIYHEQRPIWTSLQDYLNLYLLIDGLTKGRRNSEPLLPISSTPITLPPLHPIPKTPTITTDQTIVQPSNQSEDQNLQRVEVEYRPLPQEDEQEPSSPVHALLMVHNHDEDDHEEPQPLKTPNSNGGLGHRLSQPQLPYESSLCISSPPSSISISEDNFRVSSICQSQSEDDEDPQNPPGSGEAYEKIWIGHSNPPEPAEETLIDIEDNDRSSGSHVVLFVQEQPQRQSVELSNLNGSSLPPAPPLPTPEPGSGDNNHQKPFSTSTSVSMSIPNSPTLSSPTFLQSPPLSPNYTNAFPPPLPKSPPPNSEFYRNAPKKLSENGKSPTPPISPVLEQNISKSTHSPVLSPTIAQSPLVSPIFPKAVEKSVSPRCEESKSPAFEKSPSPAIEKPIAPAFAKSPSPAVETPVSPTFENSLSPVISPVLSQEIPKSISPRLSSPIGTSPLPIVAGNGKTESSPICENDNSSIQLNFSPSPPPLVPETETTSVSSYPINGMSALPLISPTPTQENLSSFGGDKTRISPMPTPPNNTNGNGTTSISPTPTMSPLPSPPPGNETLFSSVPVVPENKEFSPISPSGLPKSPGNRNSTSGTPGLLSNSPLENEMEMELQLPESETQDSTNNTNIILKTQNENQNQAAAAAPSP